MTATRAEKGRKKKDDPEERSTVRREGGAPKKGTTPGEKASPAHRKKRELAQLRETKGENQDHFRGDGRKRKQAVPSARKK